MKAIRVLQCGALCAGVLLFAALGALAQDAPKNGESEKIRIGDQQYTRGEIIADFLDVAFTDLLWNQDRGRDYFKSRLNDVPASFHSEHANKYYPWLSDYLERPLGWPKSNVINKWSGDIKIGVDLPYSDSFSGNKNYDGIYKSIESQVERILPDLKIATGRKISFVKPGNSQDRGNGFAKIRIIPTENIRTIPHSFSGGPFQFEEFLQGGVPFMGGDEQNMVAYALPDAGNSLGLVICKIRADLFRDDKFKPYVTECIARAVGLPGILPQDHAGSLFKNWKTKRESAVPSDLTPYDLYLISLLYCPAVKMGMTKNEIIEMTAKKACL